MLKTFEEWMAEGANPYEAARVAALDSAPEDEFAPLPDMERAKQDKASTVNAALSKASQPSLADIVSSWDKGNKDIRLEALQRRGDMEQAARGRASEDMGQAGLDEITAAVSQFANAPQQAAYYYQQSQLRPGAAKSKAEQDEFGKWLMGRRAEQKERLGLGLKGAEMAGKSEQAAAAMEAAKAKAMADEKRLSGQTELEKAKLGEVSRHNRAMEGIARERPDRPAENPKLTAAVTEQIAAIDTSQRELDDLLANYEKVGSENIFGRAWNAATSFLGAGEAARFTDLLKPVTQDVGKGLEGGKLAEGDIHRYREMMPGVGEDKARGIAKIKNLKRMAEIKRAELVNQLRGQGFKEVAQPEGASFVNVESNGKRYRIPKTDLAEFMDDNPGAKVLP